MGLYSQKYKGCCTNYEVSAPDPSRYTILSATKYNNGFVLEIKYSDCTNFEGKKILVYEGKDVFKSTVVFHQKIDPHFADNDQSPIARFKPDDDGRKRAHELAKNL